MTDDNPVRWGIIGPGSIAQAFETGVRNSRTGKLVAIATRNPGKAGLAENFPARASSTATQALLDDPEVEAIYIATPHPGHAEWAIKAAEAGKHVLIEKPIAAFGLRGRRDAFTARKAGGPSSARRSCIGCIRRRRSSSI